MANGHLSLVTTNGMRDAVPLNCTERLARRLFVTALLRVLETEQNGV